MISFKEFLDEKTEILKKFTNKEDATQSIVAKVRQGFSVVLKDLDSGEILPQAKIFKDMKKAVVYAKKIVG